MTSQMEEMPKEEMHKVRYWGMKICMEGVTFLTALTDNFFALLCGHQPRR